MTGRIWLRVGLAVLLAVAAGTLLWRRTSGGANVGLADPIAHFLLAVAVIVVVCHLLAGLGGLVGQPPVVGEIAGGLLLGPLALGSIWPGAHAWLFPPSVVTNVQMIAQFGLVVFMFLLGAEVRPGGSRSRRSAVGWVVLGAMGLPFLAGLGVAAAGAPVLAGTAGHRTAYLVVFGLAMSITALPVLARILVDTGLAGTRIGSLAMTCAAAGDGVSWAVLTLTLSVSGLSEHRSVPATIGLIAVLLLGAVFCVRPALGWAVRVIARRPQGDQLLLPMLVGGALAFGAATQFIGLHPIIGAFLFGVVVPRDVPQVEPIWDRLQGFAVTMLLPLFFAGIGMSTSIGSLGGSVGHWLIFLGVLVTAIATKFAGAAGGARLAGLPTRDALSLGVLMNCRGVTELVVAAIAWQYHLISPLGLTTLVLVALVTTAMTGPCVAALSPTGLRGRSPAPSMETEAVHHG